jgi:hypothetical protein
MHGAATGSITFRWEKGEIKIPYTKTLTPIIVEDWRLPSGWVKHIHMQSWIKRLIL